MHFININIIYFTGQNLRSIIGLFRDYKHCAKAQLSAKSYVLILTRRFANPSSTPWTSQSLLAGAKEIINIGLSR